MTPIEFCEAARKIVPAEWIIATLKVVSGPDFKLESRAEIYVDALKDYDKGAGTEDFGVIIMRNTPEECLAALQAMATEQADVLQGAIDRAAQSMKLSEIAEADNVDPF